jgi:hypothetical protein
MKYISDIYTGLHMALALAGIAILFLCPKLRGRGLLIAYIALGLLTQIGYLVPQLLLRNSAIEIETYEKYMKTAGVFLGLAGLAASVCLLMFIVRQKNADTTTDTTMNNNDTKDSNANKSSEIQSHPVPPPDVGDKTTNPKKPGGKLKWVLLVLGLLWAVFKVFDFMESPVRALDFTNPALIGIVGFPSLVISIIMFVREKK